MSHSQPEYFTDDVVEIRIYDEYVITPSNR